MDILPMLVGISLLLGLFFLVAFIISCRKGQMDDVVTPAWRILDDEDEAGIGDPPRDGQDQNPMSNEADDAHNESTVEKTKGDQ